MHIKREIKDAREMDTLVAAQLAVSYAFLSYSPYDNRGHEGSPAEMATFVVAQAKKDGRMGMLQQAILGNMRDFL
jgi:hypothetical protein